MYYVRMFYTLCKIILCRWILLIFTYCKFAQGTAVVQPVDRSATVGDTVTFYCSYMNLIQNWNLNIRGQRFSAVNWRGVVAIPNHVFPENLKTLSVSGVTLEDNGNTYQCIYPSVGISSRIATLHVQVRHQMSGRLSLNYHLLEIGLNCFRLTWNYEGQNCQPSIFTLQGFELAQIIDSNGTNHSTIISSSSTGSFSLITSQILRLNATFFKVSASDRTGTVCSSGIHFYNFILLLQNGISQHSSFLCISWGDVNTSDISLVWPKSYHNESYCKCLQSNYSNCASECGSMFRFEVNYTGACLLTQLHDGATIKVYVATDLYYDSCQCFITSIISSHLISSSCNNIDLLDTNSTTSLPEVLQYSRQTYAVNSLEVEEHRNLSIGVIYNNSLSSGLEHYYTALFEWRHNEEPLSTDSRVIVLPSGELVIESVKPHDTGNYDITALISNDLGCECAKFNVYVLYINTPIIDVDATSGGTKFTCISTGYPEVELLYWRSGSGEIIPDSQYNSTTEKNAFDVTLTSMLFSVGDCGQSWGYSCVVNQGQFIKNTSSLCQPGLPTQPRIFINNHNNSICYVSYSHPSYPIERYYINITSIGGIAITTHVYTSSCANASLLFRECSSVQVSITAINSLGNSEQSEYFNGSSFCKQQWIQVHLKGISNCKEWITETKLMEIASKLLTIINDDCRCNIGITFSQTEFKCSDNSPDYITFRGSFFVLFDRANDVLQIIEQWVASQPSIEISDNVLKVNSKCPVNISSSDDHECSAGIVGRSSVIIALTAGGVSAFILLSLFVLFILCLTALRKKQYKRSNNQKHETPVYEEVDGPVYEEISPNVKNYTTCEAYGVTISNQDHKVNNLVYNLEDCPAYS